jgi:hypothetical protein
MRQFIIAAIAALTLAGPALARSGTEVNGGHCSKARPQCRCSHIAGRRKVCQRIPNTELNPAYNRYYR